ncbi:FAD-dependent oxidoreductase [Photobacterium phosphoreum]|jgi:predicted NAD/FAD-binding protein|uniref:FAD-dependent oxidoreductase n=1 Tax=Photobacterium phosphoreum TaxID=659 RepID=A0AAW4ZU77_PHOPO|nr:FAD-dependent oxidoreductase [Photobacterium phosphoreum]MCD9463162.1 FAD-dependent oxidoreductase [Photobacterium phosphoreum]MCD9474292.1 FAD-dependent oxidoreductase [Photobacterium phosphoreum]MCD9484520.1 FAD-dependent oxidoreductase [Photobacterium phosphoreum]MCD9491788.1 FAD-dependent oxidoreductase [Photobacterium phosphoreum]MCF2174961.1 FAD-dependent oxidoreductase [Photobacterium phosphoreum]
MKIAIIGSGISGLTTAWYLRHKHNITLFEANDYAGGHTATVDVEVDSGQYAIDTGFIVFNDRTYPNFEQLLMELDIQGQASEMSFSVHNDNNGLEYNGHGLSSLFAQKKNLFKPQFFHFLYEITKFNRLAKQTAYENIEQQQTLGDFLQQHDLSDYFTENYILPMGAAIWSSSLADMRNIPLDFFLRFFLNHGLLDIVNRPQWYVIPGGSREYVNRMLVEIEPLIKLNSPVQQVSRLNDQVYITVNDSVEVFDHVIFACHSDQALALLADSTTNEQQILSAMAYQDNEVVLHTDESILPNEKAAWASWNYHLPLISNDSQQQLPALTYNMNILQGIDAPETFCVTLNQTQDIDPSKILRQFTYAHPVFNRSSIHAQQQRHLINGMENTWFCGAYWYNGFHEDGVRSALDVIEAIVHTDSITRSPSNDTTHSEPVSSTMNNGQDYAHH